MAEEKLTPMQKRKKRLAEKLASTEAQELMPKDRLVTIEQLLDENHPYHRTPHRPLPESQATKIVGRIAWWRQDPEKLSKLEMAYVMGATDEEACFLSGISEYQLYYYQRLHPEFANRKALLKKTPIFLAKETVIRSLKTNVQDAWSYLEKKLPDEFGNKQINVNANIDMNELAKAQAGIKDVHDMVKAQGVIVEEVNEEEA